MRAVRAALLKLLRAAGKHARRRLPLLQRQLYMWLHAAPRRRRCDPSLLKLRKGCEACLNNNCTAQRLVFAAQHALKLAG